MTNMWTGIPAEQLCNQHLLGLHKELHQEAGTLKNHPHGHAIAHGHWIRGQIDTTEIQRRHQEVAQEMQKRGMNHDSPLNFKQETVMIGLPIMEEINKKALTTRCKNCRKK